MILCFKEKQIFVHSFQYQLGKTRRDLAQLEAEKLLIGPAENLAAIGYRHNFGIDKNESLLSLSTATVSRVLKLAINPTSFVFQHSIAESTVAAYDPAEKNLALRMRYFPAEVMRYLHVDHLPYFCMFASGCSGFTYVVGAAAGILAASSDERPTLCVMADCNPAGVPYDMAEERILGSDHASAFLISRKQCGYRLLGVSYYSTTRQKVPFLEIVKRTVDIIKELGRRLEIDLMGDDLVIHYPNIFPETWKMVTRYLGNSRIEQVIDGISERAHCGSSDSVISLSKYHQGREGRIHIAVNYGVGLHLAVCVLEEKANSRSLGGVEAD